MSPPAKVIGKNSPRVISNELLQDTQFQKLEMIRFDTPESFHPSPLIPNANNENNNNNQNFNDDNNAELSPNDNEDQEAENALQYPTAEEIEAIQQEAWNSGHEVGFSTGYTEGLEKGLTEGFEQGKTEGITVGKAEGLEIGKAEGLEIGRREGFETGEKTGRAKGETESLETAKQMKDLLSSFQEAIKSLENDIADELLHLALKIAKQVIRARINSGGDYLHFLVQDALRTLPTDHGTLNIRLHPDDLMNFRVYLEDNPAHINIITDKEISRGGCQITVGNTHIDATVETRWKRSISPLGVENDWHQQAKLNGNNNGESNVDSENEDSENSQNSQNAENSENQENPKDTENIENTENNQQDIPREN